MSGVDKRQSLRKMPCRAGTNDNGIANAAPVRVALGQIRVEPGDAHGNLERAVAAIRAAADAGADAIVLPECLDLGWACADRDAGVEPIPGPRAALLAAHAATAGVLVAAGLTERDGTAIHNSAVLIERDGTLIGRHRKINELPFARALYEPGAALDVFESSIGPVGLAVCADLLAPEIGARLAGRGARLILSPCAWAVPDDHDEVGTPYGEEWRRAYGAIGRRFGVAVVGVSNVGVVRSGAWAGRRIIGRSLATQCDGSVAGVARFEAEDLPIVAVRVR